MEQKRIGATLRSVNTIRDGGTVFTTEVNAYYNFKQALFARVVILYLLNPREQNGVRTYRENTAFHQ
jgi:hypothetical protein